MNHNQEEDMAHYAANSIWGHMNGLRAEMKQARPEERGEMSRRYAIAITELEKLMGYFDTFIRGDYMIDR